MVFMRDIRLLSTDFDGTLVEHPSDGRCAEEFARELTEYKENGGLWVINTGRTLEHMIEGLELFQCPVAPDYLITIEREIYVFDKNGTWRDFGDWNAKCREQHELLMRESEALVRRIEKEARRGGDFEIIYENGLASGLVASDLDAMERISKALDNGRDEYPDFAYQRNMIYLRFCHREHSKGSALNELARGLGIPAGRVMAAGDQHNDLSMLCGTYAAHPVCPSNAADIVKELVQSVGGYVASEPAGRGVAEAMVWHKQKTNKPRESAPAA